MRQSRTQSSLSIPTARGSLSIGKLDLGNSSLLSSFNTTNNSSRPTTLTGLFDTSNRLNIRNSENLAHWREVSNRRDTSSTRRSSTLNNFLKYAASIIPETVLTNVIQPQHLLEQLGNLFPLAHSREPGSEAQAIQVYDVLYENQRGFFFIGIPKFSALLLNAFDAPPWSDRNGKPISADIKNYPLPDETWEWVQDRFMVDMSGEVDPNGWRYSFRFKSKTWFAENKLYKCFVRKRKWIRLRRKKELNMFQDEELCAIASLCSDSQPPTPTSMLSLLTPHTFSTLNSIGDENFIKLMDTIRQSRLDREKLTVIYEFTINHAYRFSNQEIKEMLSCMDHEFSYDKLQSILANNYSCYDFRSLNRTPPRRSQSSEDSYNPCFDFSTLNQPLDKPDSLLG